MTPLSPDEVCYKKNFVTKVIARVDLVSPIPEIQTTLPANLSQSILKMFPIAEPRLRVSNELQISPANISSKQSQFTEWHFHGKEREKTFTIFPSAAFMTLDKYFTYEDVRKDFTTSIGQFFSTFKEAQPSRLGLRYINTVTIDENDALSWQEYINAKLLSGFDFVPDKSMLSRIFHNIEVALDDFNLRFQYGIHNPDYPARIKQKAFVLDFDAYQQGAIEQADVPIRLDKFHTCIQDFFELSITDSLRRRMDDGRASTVR